MFDRPPELSPDLEWMLQSGQASPEMLTESLVEEFYRPLYRLGLALYGESGAAKSFARDSLLEALLKRHHYNGKTDVQTWICRQAAIIYRTGRRQNSKLTSTSNNVSPSQKVNKSIHYQAEDALHQIRDLLGEDKYLAVCLHFVLGLETSAIALILKTHEGSIQAWIAKTWQILHSCSWPTNMDNPAFSNWMEERYPEPELPRFETEAIQVDIIEQAEARKRQDKRFTYIKEMVLISFAIVMIGGVMWWISRINPNGPSPRVQVVTEVVISEQISPTEQAGENPEIDYRGLSSSIEPLDLNSSPEAVQARMSKTERLWNTMWQDVNVIFYGPPGYLGPPDAIRAQAWLGKSNQVMMIAGPLGDRPEYQFISRDKGFHHASIDSIVRWYYLSYDRHLALGMDVEYFSLPVSNLARENRRLTVKGIEVVANHQALVVDQETRTGKLESRMWIDTVSGVVLRKRLYAQSGPYVFVILDAVTSQVAYNVQFPPDIFDWQMDDEDLQFASNYLSVSNAGKKIQSRGRFANPVTIWAPRAYRESYQPYRPPPADFDPSSSRLTFQYIPTVSSENTQSSLRSVNHIASLFAEGYYLGSLNTGDPFLVICDRSPNGELLAVAQGRKSQPRGTSRLTWVKLSDSKEPNSIEIEVDLSHFAFAPDNQRLALFGYGEPLGSLYILEVDSGKLSKLLNLEYVRSLMWAPDGETLAIIGNWESPEYNEEVMVIDPDTGKVLYYTPYNYHGSVAVPDLPAWMAGRTFPEFMGGLEACTNVPARQTTVNVQFSSHAPNAPETR